MRAARWFLFGAVVASAAPVRAQAPAAASCPSCTSVLLPVATRHLPRGTVLSAGDLRVALVAQRGPHADPPEDVTGWVTRRAVRPGEVLRAPTIARLPLVARGSVVQVAVQHGPVQVTTTGVAVIDAHLDDEVPIRLGPKRIVQGRVRGPGQVQLIESRTP